MRHVTLRMMVPAGFVMAMRGSLRTGPYDAPHRQGPARAEWLILCRWGAEGEFLTIARAGPAEGPPEAPPPMGLRPHTTYLGLRLGGAVEGGGFEGEDFLLARHLPEGVTVAGTFQPSDGIVRLAGPAGTLRLDAAGRSAFRRDLGEAGEALVDLPEPAPGAADSLSWRMAGRRVPWLGEFLAPAPSSAH